MEMERQGLLEINGRSDDDEEVESKIRYPRRHNRWTKLERTLCIVTVLSLLLVFAMVAVLVVFGNIYQTNINTQRIIFVPSNTGHSSINTLSANFSTSDLCLTPGCVQAAANILSNIDESVDPCNDFYDFACGGWLNRQPIPENKPSLSVFGKSQDDLNQQLRVLMEKKLNGSEPEFISMIKDMYETCMDLKSIENIGTEPLKKVLKNLGGWPAAEGNNWDGSYFDWIDTLIAFRKLGYSYRILLDLSVSTDYRNSSVHIINLQQVSLGMPERTYLVHGLNDPSTAAYFNLMMKSAKLLGADETTVENELMKSLNFEITLANFSLPREEMRNISEQYNKYTVGELQQMVPQIPWLKYFNGLLNDKIDENEPLIVSVPEFVIKFADLITSTEKRVIANYMLWRVVLQSMLSLSTEWRNILHEFTMVIAGINQEEPRWEICVSFLTGSLDIALSSYYVRHYFDEESKESSMELFKYIHKEFLKSLEEIDWIEEETKQKAKAKANAIKPYVGYPKELLNNSIILEFYENLSITNESFFDNVMRLRKWSTDYALSELRKPNIRGEWKKYTRATNINAYYKMTENGIEFLAGILQNGFFNKNRPHYMNFGAIGFIIAHEITHGFDDIGRQFDINGNNVNWWDKTTEEHFKEKSQCIIDQYSNYSVENGMKINGINTQNENVADIAGFKQAYRAYHSWVKDNGSEQKLPGLKYSPSQMFWISAANIWCGKFRPEALKLRIITGQHSPNKFRIIGGLSNLEEFSEEFNCSPHSPMNKKYKCQVW